MEGVDMYGITNSNGMRGRAWTAAYGTKSEAAEAIRKAMGWDAVVLSDSFSDVDGNGRDRSAWCAYESQEECDADQEGAHAPRIVEASK